MDLENYFDPSTFYEDEVRPNRKPTQGDIIIPFKGLYEGPDIKLIGKRIIGIILLTNICDIENNRAKYITFAPIYRASEIINAINKELKKKWRRIITENDDSFFFIPPHEEIDINFGGVILYQDIRSEIKSMFFEKYPTPTLTLKRPYIDRLCSKIANLFSRIPIDHPEDDEVFNWIEECIKKKELNDPKCQTNEE